MYINNKSETAQLSRFLIRKIMKPLNIASGIIVLVLGVTAILIILSPIYVFKGLSKIVNKFFN